VVTFANNLLARGGDIPKVPNKVVAYLANVEKKLRQEIQGLKRNRSKTPPLKLVRVALNRQRADEESLAAHLDEGTVMNGSLHVCTDDIMGGGLRIIASETKTCLWPKGRATSLLFCGGILTHKTLKVTKGTDYGFVYFFALDDETNKGKHRLPTQYIGKPHNILGANGHATLLQFCEKTFAEPVWTYEKEQMKKRQLADAAANPQGPAPSM